MTSRVNSRLNVRMATPEYVVARVNLRSVLQHKPRICMADLLEGAAVFAIVFAALWAVL